MKTSQPGFALIFTVLGAEGLIIFLHLYSKTGPYWAIVPPSLILFIVIVLFYKLDVSITANEMIVAFGIGLIRKKIPLAEITKVRAVRNSAVIGWGIRFGWDYTLYSVSGLNAVELSLRSQSRKIRVGCKAPAEIIAFLSTKIHLAPVV